MPTPWLSDRLDILADGVIDAAAVFASKETPIVGVWLESPARIDLLAVTAGDPSPKRLQSPLAGSEHAALVTACEQLVRAVVDGLPGVARALLKWTFARGVSLRVYARPAKREVALALHGSGMASKLARGAITSHALRMVQKPMARRTIAPATSTNPEGRVTGKPE